MYKFSCSVKTKKIQLFERFKLAHYPYLDACKCLILVTLDVISDTEVEENDALFVALFNLSPSGDLLCIATVATVCRPPITPGLPFNNTPVPPISPPHAARGPAFPLLGVNL